MAIDFGNIDTVNRLLGEAQDADEDNRQRSREAIQFLNKRDGQWEQNIFDKMVGRPRYTFDKCNPIVDDITADIKKTSFGINVQPAGGDASEDLAKTINGIVRNIQNISNAKNIFNTAARKMVASGLSGWEVVSDWINSDSFDQDLIIKPIADFVNKVWFVNGSMLQTQEDAPGVFILDSLTPEQYDDKFPDGGKQGIGDDKCYEAYTQKPDYIKVGRIIYKETKPRTLVLMSDGAVYTKDNDFKKVQDELAEEGITINKERDREETLIYSRIFDGGGWLNKRELLPFKHLPVIPNYGNFDVDDDGKIIYSSAIEHLLDAQRTYNYSRSREVEEVVLAPKAKYWGTRKQFQVPADMADAKTLNTNNKGLQLYTPDEAVPGPPLYQGGATINSGLQVAIQSSLSDIQTSASTFNPEATQTSGPLSQVAIEALENKGNSTSLPYLEAQEIIICQTGKVIVGAMSIYDSKRIVRIIGEDGKQEMVTLNELKFDHDTGTMVEINDLSKGTYDVTCDVGPMFKSRQEQTVSLFNELGVVIPGFSEMTADITLANISAPGADLAKERVRAKLLQAGVIPESQMTDEEKEDIKAAQEAAAQNPPDPTPEDKIADAEIARVQAETADVAVTAQLKQEDQRIREQDSLLKHQNAAEKLGMEELTLALKQQSQAAQEQAQINQALMDGQTSIIDNLNKQAQTLKTLREAAGVDTIVGPHTMEAFVQQAETITAQQDDIQATPETDDVV